MVDRDVVLAKLVELDDRIARVRSLCPASAAELTANRDTCDLVAFNVMLTVQSRLDIASHVIADEGLRPATTLADAFRRLAEHGILRRETADALGRAAGFRNVVAHGYADLEGFAREVAAWLRNDVTGS